VSTQYEVVWPYATVKVVDGATGQPTFRGFNEGSILPTTADPADVKRLVGKGAVEVLGGAAPETPEPDPEPEHEAEPESELETETESAPEPEAEFGPEPSIPARPKDYGSKQEWVDYAVACRDDDVSEGDARYAAERKTRDALIAEFG